jgi:hypothetical protein
MLYPLSYGGSATLAQSEHGPNGTQQPYQPALLG